MTNTVTKKNPNDMTRKELIQRLKWPERTFTDRFKRFLDYYGIDKRHFTYDVFDEPEKDAVERSLSTVAEGSEDELRKFLIDYRYKDLLFVLMKAFEYHPLYRKNYKEKAITLDKVIAYNERLIDLVDTLPDGIRHTTMNHPTYYRTVNQLPAMKKMSAKMHQFLAASVLVPKQVRLQVWEEMFDFVDYMIFRTYDLSIKYKSDQVEAQENKKAKAREHSRLLKADPDHAYHTMLTELLDGKAGGAKPDSDLPCDTLDGYLALRLKVYIDVIEQLEANPRVQAEAEKMFHLSQELATVSHAAIAKKIGAAISDVKEAEQEIWKQEVESYAKQAKLPFTDVVDLKESMIKIWEQYKDEAEADCDQKHYKGFLDFYEKVEQAVHKGDYLLSSIVNDPILSMIKDTKSK